VRLGCEEQVEEMECWCRWWVGRQGGCCLGSEGRICHFRGRGRYGGKLSLSLMIRDRDHGGSGAGWPCFAASRPGGVMRKLGPTPDWSPRLLYFVQTVIFPIYLFLGCTMRNITWILYAKSSISLPYLIVAFTYKPSSPEQARSLGLCSFFPSAAPRPI
jgi:hypothetical protein